MRKSPFAGDPGWELKLKMLPTKWTGVEKLIEESSDKERDIKIARFLNSCQFLTAVQIMQTPIWQQYTGINKKHINKLARAGYLVKHGIRNKGYELPIYSAGPAAYYKGVIGGYKINFYKGYGLTTVLKILSANQLFLRLLKHAYVRSNFNALPPYTAELHYIEKKYGPWSPQIVDKEKTIKVISIRGYENDISEMRRSLQKVDEKAIVIAHDISLLNEIKNDIEGMSNLRLTCDDHLFKGKLSDAFYKAGNSELIKTHIPNFED